MDKVSIQIARSHLSLPANTYFKSFTQYGTLNLDSFLQPELEPQTEVDPAEVLEFEHGLEVVAPDGGGEAEVDGANVSLEVG